MVLVYIPISRKHSFGELDHKRLILSITFIKDYYKILTFISTEKYSCQVNKYSHVVNIKGIK